MQIGFTMVRALFGGFARGVGGWCSTAPGFTSSYDQFPRFEENSPPEGLGVLVAIGPTGSGNNTSGHWR